MPKTMKKDRQKRSFWSKRRDSNPRSPVPEAIGSSLLTTFIYFLVLFSPKAMLSDALVRTVSTQSKSVDGQRCGHRANFARLKARKLNRIYPVLSFIFCRQYSILFEISQHTFPKTQKLMRSRQRNADLKNSLSFDVMTKLLKRIKICVIIFFDNVRA